MPYEPLVDCPKCHGVGFLHPRYPDGRVNFRIVSPCDYPGCLKDDVLRYKQGDYAAGSGVLQPVQTFDTFDAKVPGVAKAYKMAYDIAEGVGDYIWLIIYGGTGNGKCLGKGVRVITATGEPRNVEDIKVGDRLLGPNGDIKTVLALSRGYGKLYRVTQTHGKAYIVNENHILCLRKSVACAKYRGERMPSGNWRRPRGKYPDYNYEINIPVWDYLTKSKAWKHYFYGYRQAVEFPYRPVTVAPYLLGLWLGDGDNDRTVITTVDEEVKEYIFGYAQNNGLEMSVYDYRGNIPSYKLKAGDNACLTHLFREYNLLNNKHIPPEYLYNSTDVRLSLLAGIIDSDGSFNTNCYDVTQKNKRLACDIQYLCHSLGLRCSMHSVSKGIKATGFGGEYYRLNISGHVGDIPVKVKRKIPSNIRNNKDPSLSSIVVEYIGEGEYYGFDIAGDGLFLLEDFTVTHNSHLLNAIANRVIERGFGARYVLMADLLSELRMAIKTNETDEKLQELKRVPYLLIDEVGLEYGSDWEKQKVDELLTARWANGRFTVAATNLDIEQLPDRIRSRFKDKHLSRYVKNEAADYRVSHGSAKRGK